MKILSKVKMFFKSVGKYIKGSIIGDGAKDTTGIFVSTYYATFGLLMTLMTLSPIIFITFAFPAIAWWIVVLINTYHMERACYEGIN